MNDFTRLYNTVEGKSLIKQIDKFNSQISEACPHCGKRALKDFKTILECTFCKSNFFSVSKEKITDPKLLIAIQQIQNIMEEYKLGNQDL